MLLLSMLIMVLAGCTTVQSTDVEKRDNLNTAWDIDYGQPKKYIDQGPYTHRSLVL